MLILFPEIVRCVFHKMASTTSQGNITHHKQSVHLLQPEGKYYSKHQGSHAQEKLLDELSCN